MVCLHLTELNSLYTLLDKADNKPRSHMSHLGFHVTRCLQSLLVAVGDGQLTRDQICGQSPTPAADYRAAVAAVQGRLAAADAACVQQAAAQVGADTLPAE